MVKTPCSVTLSQPTFFEAFKFWLKLGFISFGGPAGQIAIMHREVVERRCWVSEQRFLHALNYCMLLPGPEAQQLATYLGWALHGTRGGLVAGILFVLPAALLLLALSFVYVQYGTVKEVAAFFYGLQAAVLAVVAAAVLRIGRKALKTPALTTLAACAFAALFFFGVPFVAVILLAAFIGWAGGRYNPAQFLVIDSTAEADAPVDRVQNGQSATAPRRVWQRQLRIAAVGIAIWVVPTLLTAWVLGGGHVITRLGIFFSQAALVTFGGAYAVLPFVAQHAVENAGWISPAQMMAGMGLAETTPGPLIMVLQFVGFVAAWQGAGSLPPWVAAVWGAGLTTWVTFAPSFLFIFLGAPFIERLQRLPLLNATLSAVTAAVVGVILNLAAWFALQVVFPNDTTVDLFMLVVGATLFVGLWKAQWGILPVVLGSGCLGLVWHYVS